MSRVQVRPINTGIAFLADETITIETDLPDCILYTKGMFCRTAEISTDTRKPTDKVTSQSHNAVSSFAALSPEADFISAINAAKPPSNSFVNQSIFYS